MNAPLPKTLHEKLAVHRCALLVIDMQNDFCAPGGYVERIMKKDVSAALPVARAVSALLQTARRAGVPVLWLRADYSRDCIPDSMRVKLEAAGITAECCQPDTWGAQWFCVEPETGDPVVTKHTYSGFAGTDLQERLRAWGRRTLVFTGVQTQVCVESTLRDAHSLGYFCVVPRDAVGSHTPALHEATLVNVRFLFGDVCTTADICKAWEQDKNAA